MEKDKTENHRGKYMNLLTMEHVSKAYTDRVLLDDVGFGINKNEKIGVIGVNGMGKSTLLKIVAGIEESDAGTISMGNQVKICYLPQTPVFEAGTTILRAATEGNYDELNRWTIEAEAKSMLNQLGFTDYDEKIEHMSGGQKKRVALVRALLTPAGILVLDEPTNHLDNEMSEWLEEYLIQFRGAILMVTHDRYFLDRVVNRIVEVDHGKLYNYPGNYSEFVRLKAERQNMELATERKRKSLLRTELEWLHRGARARSTKQKAHIDRIHAMQEMKDIQEEKRVMLDSVASRMGNKTIELSGICKSYGEKKLIDDFSYIFARYEKMGIVGNNGTGKSTFIKILMGQVQPDSGTVDIGETVRFGYYSQDGLQFDEQMKVIDVVQDIAEVIELGNGKKLTASQFLQHFLFTPETQHSYVYKLSGGERRRLYLCTVLMRNPNFLVLDEPTNDLDIITLNVLEEYLQNFKGCVIVVSHDRYFMDKVVDHLMVFNGQGDIRDFPGNYSDYRDWKDAKAQQEKEAEKPQEEKTARVRLNDKRKMSFKEKREFEQLEKEIAELETEKAQIEEQLCSGTLSVDELTEKSKRLPEVNDLIDEKTMRWLELSEIEG